MRGQGMIYEHAYPLASGGNADPILLMWVIT